MAEAGEDARAQRNEFVKKALLALQKPDFRACKNYLDDAISLSDTDYRLFGIRSLCYRKLLQYKKASKDADIAVERAPDDPWCHCQRGHALVGLGKMKKAKRVFRAALQMDNNDQEVKNQLKQIEVYLKQSAHAKLKLKQVISKMGRSVSAASGSSGGAKEIQASSSATSSNSGVVQEMQPSISGALDSSGRVEEMDTNISTTVSSGAVEEMQTTSSAASGNSGEVEEIAYKIQPSTSCSKMRTGPRSSW